MNGDVQVKQPELLTCTLKEYQLKGLNWLANLYEQGINGILADEMVRSCSASRCVFFGQAHIFDCSSITGSGKDCPIDLAHGVPR